MKAKKFGVLAVGILSMAALGGIVAYQNSTSKLSFFTKASVDHSASYTITADDFTAATGDIQIDETTIWHYNAASVDGGVVTLTSAFFTKTASGATKNGSGIRGLGYTSITIADFAKTGDGHVLYTKDANNGSPVGHTPAATIDLSGVNVANRKHLEFAMGQGATMSFSSMTFNYDCGVPTPTIDIQGSVFSVGVSENANISALATEVYGDDTVTYSWSSSDADVLLVSGNTLKGTLTGVAAGTANAIITMTVNGTEYTDSVEVTVNAVAATIEPLAVLNATSRIEGAGIFCRFSPSNSGLTQAEVDSFAQTDKSLTFTDSTTKAIKGITLQEKSNDSYTAYLNFDDAVGLNSAFTIVIDFKDNVNNIIYRGTWHFDGGSIAPETKVVVSNDTVNVGDTVTVTATKGFFLDGEPSFNFVADDGGTYASMNVVGNVATLEGVSAGTVTVTVTMTIGGNAYAPVAVEIEVVSSITEVPLTITGANWGGSGCQFYTDMSKLSGNLADYTVTVTVTGSLQPYMEYSGQGACFQGNAVYLTFNYAPAAGSGEYTLSVSLQKGANNYTFTVSFDGVTMQ